MKKIGVAATLAILSLVPTGCVNLEALRQLSDPQTIGTQSSSSEQTLPEKFDGPLELTSDSPRTICQAWGEDHDAAEKKYEGKLITVTEKGNSYYPHLGDLFEFGWDSDGESRRYYTDVKFEINRKHSVAIVYKDFSESTDWEKGKTYNLTAQIVDIGSTGTRCQLKLSNGYKYRVSSKLF